MRLEIDIIKMEIKRAKREREKQYPQKMGGKAIKEVEPSVAL